MPPDDTPTHLCPPDGATVTPCCGRTPFELPRTARMTSHTADVTCRPPTTAGEAEAFGWTVDRTVYPWRAYTGSCFEPARVVQLVTPAFVPRRAS